MFKLGKKGDNEKLIFKVRGSKGETYSVEFYLRGNNIRATCTCKAAQNGLHCKHRIRLFRGDNTGLVSSNQDELSTLAQWLPGSDVEQALDELDKAEEELKSAQKKVAGYKKKLARVFSD